MVKRILLILLVLIIALPFVLWFGAPVVANYQLRNFLAKADTASYSYMQLDLWEGDLVIHDIYLIDTSGAVSKQPVLVSLNRIALKGLDLWKLYKTRHIDIDSLVLGKGELNLPLYKYIESDNTDADTTKPNKLNIPFHDLTLQHVAIDSIGFVLTLNPKNQHEKYSGVISFKADSISIPFKKDEKLSYKTAQLKLANVYAQPKKSLAYYSLDSLQLSAENHTLALHGFKLRQRIGERRYAAYFGTDKVYAKVDVNHIRIKGLPKRLRSLAEGVHLSHISIIDPQAYMYKNSRMPHSMNEKKFIIEALYAVKLPIRVDTVQIEGGQLLFNQNWREDYVPGVLRLSITKAQMLNYTNMGPNKEHGKWTTLTAELLMYDELKLLVDWRFDLAKKGTAFTLDVIIGQSSFKTLNPFTENTVGLRFKSGRLLGGHLLVEGDKESGAGSLELYYSDMKVEFLDREDHHKNIIHWGEGGLANLLVKNNNLKDKKPRVGIVYAEPVLDKAIFAFATKMLFSGFQDIALTSSNESLVAQRGMTYLPMPKQAQENADKAAAKQEKRDKKAQRKAERKAKKAEKKAI